MTASLLILALAVGAADESAPPRKPSAIAPSLPALTREEEDKIDDIVERFMLADTGRLKGSEARQAVREFEALKIEAVPALIRGLNKAAGLQHSCPVLMISKKLRTMLFSSNDPQLLEFARDEIGAGVGRTRYAGHLQDLRFACLMRKNALARLPALPRTPREMSMAELVKSIGSERGPRLKPLLVELEGRKGKEVPDGLAVGCANTDPDTRKLARDLLDRHLIRGGADFVKEQLTSNNPEVRQSGARAAADKFPALASYVIELLADDRAEVRAEAHAALVRLAKSEDFGPDADASAEQRQQAQARWRAWLERK
jgi:hypothetical protein